MGLLNKILILGIAILPLTAYSVEECRKRSFDVTENGFTGDDVWLFSTSTGNERIINKKQTEIFGTRRYSTLDRTASVNVSCVKGKRSFVEIVSPEWLRDSHRGWINSRNLKIKPKVDLVADCKKLVGYYSGSHRIVKNFLYSKNGKERWKDRVILQVNTSDFFRCDYDNESYSRISAEKLVNGNIVKKY